MEKNKNEIDLIELLIKTYLIIRKYIIILIIPIVIGIVYTIIKSVSKTPIFSSYMIIKAQTEDDFMYTITLKEFQNKFDKNPVEIIEKIIKEASDYRSNGNLEILSKRMNLPEEKVKQLVSLSTSYKYEKGEAYSNLITIHARTTDPKLYMELSSGITNYINNNEYIKNKYVSDSILLSNTISKLDDKIHELDSVQKQLLKKGIYQSNITIAGEFSLFAESIQLTALKEKLNSKINVLNKAVVIESFYIPSKADKNSNKDFYINGIISIFIGILIILFIVLNKKANQYQKQH
jgi:hypothetical protein